MKTRQTGDTSKTTETSHPKVRRPLIRRGCVKVVGAGNIFVIKNGEDLSKNLQDRLDRMKTDYETVEFYWNKIISDPNYNETRQFPEHTQLINKWELHEGVKTLFDYKSKMKRLKTLIDHFNPRYDYELTVNEVVEILT